LIVGDCVTVAMADVGYTVMLLKAHRPSITERNKCFLIFKRIKIIKLID
jgi:hypothetical protein